MKTLISKIRIIAVIAFLISIPSTAFAQWGQIVNQLPSLISPAISGNGSYRGFFDAGYSKTVGHYDADFLEFSTTQGYQYNSWFYMGVGLGADVMFAHQDNNWGTEWQASRSFDFYHSSRKTAVMIPVFTDFRFKFGGSEFASFFADLRTGCSFLMTNDYICIGNGYLTSRQYFYLRPSIGMRIPLSSNNPKQAVNIGISYKLLTSNYWSSWNRNITLNSIGASVGFEW